VPTERDVAYSPPPVKEELNLHEVIDSNPFTQLESSHIEPEESQALHTNKMDSGTENDTQDRIPEGDQILKPQDSEELNYEDTEVAIPRGLHQPITYQGSDSRASTEQEPPFDLYGEDTLDGMGESRDDSRKAFGVSQTPELQRYNSLSGMMGTENSTQDGADTQDATQENESQKRLEKQSGDKMERRHDKKDKKDRKERKKDRKERKHDKHNDPEYLDKKRKRKEEREQRHRQEGHKSSKEDKHRKEDINVKLEEKPASDVPVDDFSQLEGTKAENQGGTDIMKIKFKFKKPRTTA